MLFTYLISIVGVPCEIESMTSTEIVCITGTQPAVQTLYPGNRGIYKEMWANTAVDFDNLAEISNYTDTNPATNYTIEWLDQAGGDQLSFDKVVCDWERLGEVW